MTSMQCAWVKAHRWYIEKIIKKTLRSYVGKPFKEDEIRPLLVNVIKPVPSITISFIVESEPKEAK